MRNKGWSRVHLAEKTGYDEKTVRNILSGNPARDQTIIDICQTLGIEPHIENDLADIEVAEDPMGGYLRRTHRHYEGYFASYRRSFSKKGALYKSVTGVKWVPASNHFQFSDYYDLDPEAEYGAKAHQGAVYMSSYTNLIHFMTVYEGSLRVATLTKMREGQGIMRGTILTQSESLMFFQPTIAPIVLVKLKQYDPESSLRNDLRLISEGDPEFDFAMEQIDITEKQIVKVAFGWRE